MVLIGFADKLLNNYIGIIMSPCSRCINSLQFKGRAVSFIEVKIYFRQTKWQGRDDATHFKGMDNKG
jgi:hypothetical protein